MNLKTKTDTNTNGTNETNIFRPLAILLIRVCATMGEKGSSLRSSKLIKNLNQKLFELTGNKLTSMTQDERWITRYEEVKTFIETNKPNLSKYVDEERNMVNYLKHTRKQMNQGLLKAERIPQFEKLLELMEQYKRKNQYM